MAKESKREEVPKGNRGRDEKGENQKGPKGWGRTNMGEESKEMGESTRVKERKELGKSKRGNEWREGNGRTKKDVGAKRAARENKKRNSE